MAQLIIAAAGAAIGGAIPGFAAAAGAIGMTGGGLGWAIGSLIGSAFAPGQKSQGPRLNDLSVSSSAYGTPIPYTQGSPRIAGQIVWASTKREIATTTSQGKGGGGSEFTSYTYEIDLLILLTDNEIEGISRVWSNGKLVWNKSSTATAATKAASDEYAGWTRFSVYTGASTQSPDTTYEAAVETANAPAYRGRGSVFIQSLQLGQSGQIPNLTFEIDEAWDGDHAINDGLTRLQTLFAGASSADVSEYLIGSGTNDEATLYDGYASLLFDSNANPKSLVYSDVGLALLTDVSSLTYEIFFTSSLDTPSPQSPGDLIKFAQFTLHQHGLDFFIKAIPDDDDIRIVQTGYVDVVVTSAHTYGVQNHLALVNRSTGVMDVYLNGVRVIEARDNGTARAGSGTLQLGGIGRGDTRIKYHGARVRRAEMYSDASFSAPAGPEAWGNP